MEVKKLHLEQERRTSPLLPHTTKKDFVSPCEAVLIYYQIEPAIEHLSNRNIKIIQAVDYLGIYDVLMSSKFMLNSRPYIMLIDFIEFLKSKKFTIPKHLTHEDSQLHKKAIRNILQFDLMKFSQPQLKNLIIRALAANFWQNATTDEDRHLAATCLAIRKSFQDALNDLGIEITDCKKFAEKFSDMRPRCKKTK